MNAGQRYALPACTSHAKVDVELAVVTGYVVCTVRHEGLAHDKLLMMEILNARSRPNGQCAVAVDNIGTGCGEQVLLVSSSLARQAHAQGTFPINLCMISIVDEAAADGQVPFHRQGEKS